MEIIRFSRTGVYSFGLSTHINKAIDPFTALFNVSKSSHLIWIKTITS